MDFLGEDLEEKFVNLVSDLEGESLEFRHSSKSPSLTRRFSHTF